VNHQDTAAAGGRESPIDGLPSAQCLVDSLRKDGPNISVDAQRDEGRRVMLGRASIDDHVAAPGTSGLQRYVGSRRHHQCRSESDRCIGPAGTLKRAREIGNPQFLAE
jgi:hypothetical protein